jgi:glycosyltransferase involved in cell wall biosynthesis
MQFSIITPSFRGAEWLPLCLASVADQQGVSFEHLVQDACSDDGTAEILRAHPQVQAVIEKDRGMYDAVNRGYRRAKGDIVAYLNCDEQYLPGALASVWEYFQRHPEVEVVFATALVTDPDGGYVCDRVPSVPQLQHSRVSGNLAILTAATFCRRWVFHERGLYFDDGYRDVGDAVWVMRLIQERVAMGVLPVRTSIFTETGNNMNLRPNGIRERAELLRQAPWWARRFRAGVVLHYRLRRLLAGHYLPGRAYDYQIYTRRSPRQRVTVHVERPRFRFQPRLAAATA